MNVIAVELATAYVSLVPSALGIAGKVAQELAPVEGAAAATGARAGSALSSGLTGQLNKVVSALPTASLGPVGSLLGAGLVAGFGAALVGIGREFDASRRQIVQQTGETGADLAGTFDTVKRVFAEVPASLTDVTTAVDELRQRGVPLGAQLDHLAQQEIELSKITKTDLGTNVEATTALFAKFQVSLKDQPAALDAIFKASQASGRGIGDLLDNMKTGGAALQQFGFGIAQSAALIASLERAGVNVQPALAGLRKGFSDLAKAGADPKKALADLIAEFSNGTPPTHALSDAIKLFGTRAGTELATAIQHGTFNVKDLIATITNGKGGILSTAEQTRSFADNLEILKNKAELALQPLGSAIWTGLRGIFADLSPAIADVANSVGHLLVQLEPVGVLLGGAFIGAFKIVGPLLEAFATGIGTVASILSHVPGPLIAAAAGALIMFKAFKSLGELETVFARLRASEAAFLLDSPLGILAVSVAALGAAIEVFGGKSSTQAKLTKSFGDSLFGAGSGADTLGGQLAALQPNVEKIATAFIDSFHAGSNVRAVLDDIGGGTKGLTAALEGSDSAFHTYVGNVTAAAFASGSSVFQTDALGNSLKEQRKALEDAESAQVANLVTTGAVKQAQVDAAAASVKQKEGYVDLAAVLKILNGEVTATAEATTKSALQTPTLAAGLSQLAAEYAKGTITATTFASAIADLNVDQATAKTVAGDISKAIDDQANSAATATPKAHQLAAEFAAGTVNAGDYAAGLLGLSVDANGLSTAMSDGITIQKDAAAALADTKDKALLAGPAVAGLNVQFLRGKLSAGQLEGGVFALGTTLKGAQGDVTGLASAVDSFAKSATSALPNAGGALQTFNSNVSTAFSALVSAQNAAGTSSTSAQKAVETATASLDKAGTSASAAATKTAENAQRALDAARLRLQNLEATGRASATSIANAETAVTNAQNHLNAALAAGGTAGAASVKNAQANLDKANANLAASQGKSSAAVVAAQKALEAAVNPEAFIDDLTRQAQAIGNFQKNLGTLVAEGLGNLAGVLAAKGSDAGGALAQAFVGDHTKAVLADGAVRAVTVATDTFGNYVHGNAVATAMGATGQALADSFNKGFATNFSITHPTQQQLDSATLLVAAANPALTGVAQGLARAGVVAFDAEFGRLPSIAEIQSGATAAALNASGGSLANAAHGAGNQAAVGFTSALGGLAAGTSTAISNSKGVWSGQVTIDTAKEAETGGIEVGSGFALGITEGLTSSGSLAHITGAAREVAQAGVDAAKNQLGIQSPSTVAHQLGVFFVDGLIAGLDQTRVSQHMQAVVGTITASVSAQRSLSTATPTQQHAGVTFSPTYHVTGNELPTEKTLDVINRKETMRLAQAGSFT